MELKLSLSDSILHYRFEPHTKSILINYSNRNMLDFDLHFIQGCVSVWAGLTLWQFKEDEDDLNEEEDLKMGDAHPELRPYDDTPEVAMAPWRRLRVKQSGVEHQKRRMAESIPQSKR